MPPTAVVRTDNAPLQCAIVRGRAQFEAREGDWNDLFRRGGPGANVFQTFDWCWHWANHYLASPGGSCELAVVTVRRAGSLVALWPLMLVRKGPVCVAKWMGEPVSQYGDGLVDPAEDQAAIAAASLACMLGDLGAQALHLRKVRADARATPLLALAGASVTETAAAPFLALASAPDFAHYEQRYPSKARKNRRRLARRLAGHGSVTTTRLTQGPEARAAALEAIGLKQRSLADTGRVSPALADPRFAAFFADAADGGAHPCGCGVSQMRVDGRLVASAIDVSANGHRAAHLIVHNPEFDDCGAGMLMIEQWVRTACDDGMAVFDLLAPAHAYKSDWADGTTPVHDYALAASPLGQAVVTGYYGFLRPLTKRAVETAARWISSLRARLDGRKGPRACDGKRPSGHHDQSGRTARQPSDE